MVFLNNVLEKYHIAYFKENEKNAVIISTNGKLLLLDKKLFNDLKNNKPSEALLNKLSINGFTGEFNSIDFKKIERGIRFFMIDFSTCCNLSCYYCLRDFVSKGSIIKKEELQPILDYIYEYCLEYHVYEISIQPWGGEPLLAFDLILFMDDYFKKHQIKANISIQTNGTLLSEKRCIELQKRNISLGISIDGNAYIHNLHRPFFNGNDSYKETLNAIKLIRKIYDHDVATISVITKHSIEHIVSSITSLSEAGVGKIKFNIVHPNSDAFPLEDVPDKLDIEKMYEAEIKTLIQLNRDGKTIYDTNINDRLINLLVGYNGELCHSFGCLGGYKFVTVARNGDIYPCELVGHEQVKIGNISQGDLHHQIMLSIYNGNHYFDKKDNEKCHSCIFERYCKGGCTASILSYNKALTNIDDVQCDINTYLYPTLIDLILNKPEDIYYLSGKQIKIEGD